MKLKFIITSFLIVVTISVQAQKKRKHTNVDTLISNYDPANLFSPMFYAERGNDRHSANGEPGPKY